MTAPADARLVESPHKSAAKLKKKAYEQEYARLQVELVKMQNWINATGRRLVVLFEGATRPARAASSSGSPRA